MNRLKGELASPGVLLEKYNKLANQLKFLRAFLLVLTTVLVTILLEQYILDKPNDDDLKTNGDIVIDSSYVNQQVTNALKVKLDCLGLDKQKLTIDAK